ncbi:MAG: hypothetical protein OXC62_16340 [Aestuariivita sp.]|nr:hypothetical protein [Aestuariivita sp.]
MRDAFLTETMIREARTWQDHCNVAQHSVNWRFTTDGAHITLKSLYPSIQ